MDIKKAADFFTNTLKTDHDKIQFCMTFLGIAGQFFQYIHGNVNEKPKSQIMYYCSAITIANLLALDAQKAPIQTCDLSLIDIPDREKLLRVVKHLYELYKDEINGTT